MSLGIWVSFAQNDGGLDLQNLLRQGFVGEGPGSTRVVGHCGIWLFESGTGEVERYDWDRMRCSKGFLALARPLLDLMRD